MEKLKHITFIEFVSGLNAEQHQLFLNTCMLGIEKEMQLFHKFQMDGILPNPANVLGFDGVVQHMESHKSFFISYSVNKSSSMDYSYLRMFYVVPEHRNSGIGKKVLGLTEQLCKEMGFTAIELEAEDISIDFFKKQNYHLTGQPRSRMKKTL